MIITTNELYKGKFITFDTDNRCFYGDGEIICSVDNIFDANDEIVEKCKKFLIDLTNKKTKVIRS